MPFHLQREGQLSQMLLQHFFHGRAKYHLPRLCWAALAKKGSDSHLYMKNKRAQTAYWTMNFDCQLYLHFISLHRITHKFLHLPIPREGRTADKQTKNKKKRLSYGSLPISIFSRHCRILPSSVQFRAESENTTKKKRKQSSEKKSIHINKTIDNDSVRHYEEICSMRTRLEDTGKQMQKKKNHRN